MEQNGYINESVTNGEKKPNLDAIFSALADPTRRAILAKLAEGDTTVLDLAEPFEISQPAISKHLKVLEKAGLVERSVEAQRRPVSLKADNMAHAVEWLDYFKKFWSQSFDQLDELLEDLKGKS